MNARSAIELTEFEQIEAGPGTVLLRVAARAADASVAGERPVLVITDRGRIQRLTALPAPPDPAGVLRAAFSAPVALVESASRFSLELARRLNARPPGAVGPTTSRRARPGAAVTQGGGATGARHAGARSMNSSCG